MQVSAKAKFIRTSPRKIRLVVDAVRTMKVEDALNSLRFMNKKAAEPVMKIINSAISNAEHNFELAKNNLYIKEIKVDEAPTIKRWMPRAHGRATTIRKRNSHIIVVLGEVEDSGDKKAKKVKIESPVKLSEAPKEEKKQSAIKEDQEQNDKDAFDKDLTKEKGKETVNPRLGGRGGHSRAEGGSKGFSSKIFRRKSG